VVQKKVWRKGSETRLHISTLKTGAALSSKLWYISTNYMASVSHITKLELSDCAQFSFILTGDHVTV
jgi:hypothetical protein